jgi:hypothetical protein
VIRLFKVYYPVRTLILLAGEALIVWTSFLLATVLELREDSYLVLNYEGGYLKILAVTVLVLLCSYWFDLYDTARLTTKGELYFRLLLVPGLLAFVLAAVSLIRPNYLLGSGSSELGLLILTVALIGWRMGSPGPCSAILVEPSRTGNGSARNACAGPETNQNWVSKSPAGPANWKAQSHANQSPRT